MTTEEYIVKCASPVLPCYNTVAQSEELPYSVFFIDSEAQYDKDGIYKYKDSVELYVVAGDYESLQRLKGAIAENLVNTGTVKVKRTTRRDASENGSQWISQINLTIENYETSNRI